MNAAAYSGAMNMSMPSMPGNSGGQPAGIHNEASDPVGKVLSKDDIHLAVKAAKEDSPHHDIREYLEAGGIGVGILGSGVLLFSTHRRWKKAHALAKGASICR